MQIFHLLIQFALSQGSSRWNHAHEKTNQNFGYDIFLLDILCKSSSSNSLRVAALSVSLFITFQFCNCLLKDAILISLLSKSSLNLPTKQHLAILCFIDVLNLKITKIHAKILAQVIIKCPFFPSSQNFMNPRFHLLF